LAKRKPLPPRRLRMNRDQRLRSARTFIRNYTGGNIARGYSRWYGVDRRCAVLELQMLGVRLKKDYVAAVLETARVQEDRAIAARMERELAVDEENLEGSDFFSWPAGEDDDEVPF
jgi:hypothetical protein